jgi:hypothetical protein
MLLALDESGGKEKNNYQGKNIACKLINSNYKITGGNVLVEEVKS